MVNKKKVQTTNLGVEGLEDEVLCLEEEVLVLEDEVLDFEEEEPLP